MTVSRNVPTSLTPPAPELADVLNSLGHNCPMGCARASDELGAAVWSTRTGLPLPGRAHPTLVIVDSSASLAPHSRSRRLVHFVDSCARTDGIRVRERRASDNGQGQTAL